MNGPPPAVTRAVALILICAALALLWRWRTTGNDAIERGHASNSETALGEQDEASESATAGVIAAGDRPKYAEHSSMHFLRFHYASGNVALRHAQRTEGTLKPIRSLRGMFGIYYRSLSAEGVPLADGVIPDPLVVHYHFPESIDPDGTVHAAEAGNVRLDETEFVITLPALAEPARSIELFSVSREEAGRSEYAQPDNRLGIFPLPVSD